MTLRLRRQSISSAAICVAAVGALGLCLPALPAADDLGLLIGHDQQINAGETRTYELSARTGQFVEVELDQNGGSGVSLGIAGPDHQVIARCEIPNGANGPQIVAILAPSSGTYFVIVSPSANTGGPSKFAVRTAVVRDATLQDRARAAAEITYVHAQELQARLSIESRRAAIEEYERALAFFESANDSYRVGMILNAIGLVHARMGDMRPAVAYFQRAEGIFHDLKDQVRESDSINNSAGAFDVLGDLDKAREMYERALSMSRATGDRRGESNRLSNIGKILNDQARFQDALSYYQQALSLNQLLGDPRRVAIVLGNIGSSYMHLAEYESARDYLLRATEMEGRDRDSISAQHLVNLGSIYDFLNRPAEGVPYFQRALDIIRAIGDKRVEGAALSTYGVTLAHAGDLISAVDVLSHAVELSQAAGDRREEAVALNNLASVSILRRQFEPALDQAHRSLEAFLAVGDANGEAKAFLSLAQATRALGKLTEARDFAAQALAKDEESRTNAGADRTRASFFASRQDDYQFMIDLLMDLHARDTGRGWAAEALSISERARARSLMDLLTESRARISAGVDPVLLARQHTIADTLNSKGARLFAAPPRSAQAEALRNEIRDLEREEQETQADIRRTSPRYAELTQPRPLTSTQIQRELLDRDSVLLEFSLGPERSVLWAVTSDRLESWILPSRQAIEAQVAEVYDLLTARSASPHLETHAEAQRRIAAADRKLAAAARELSNSILGPARSVLRDKRLVVIPDGALQRLPFSMLPEPGSESPLVLDHEIVVLPSASALYALRAEVAGRKPAPKNLAVFADPVFDRSDPRFGASEVGAASAAGAPTAARILEHAEPDAPASAFAGQLKIARLPFTAQEATEILRVAPDPSNLKAVSFQASRALATSGVLSQYRFIHFATHGYLDTERPSLSALVLAQFDAKGQPQDGFLRVDDIYNARLSADLAVLSACQTGLGKEVRGEGLMGLTRAFLYAGVPRVIVSMWNVNDRATADLMASLYRGMLRDGMRPSEALRAAQLELRKKKRWESPFYWAAFVQQGEWR